MLDLQVVHCQLPIGSRCLTTLRGKAFGAFKEFIDLKRLISGARQTPLARPSWMGMAKDVRVVTGALATR